MSEETKHPLALWLASSQHLNKVYIFRAFCELATVVGMDGFGGAASTADWSDKKKIMQQKKQLSCTAEE